MAGVTVTVPALLVVLLIVAAETALAVRRVRRQNARAARLAVERHDRIAEDFYWRYYRHEALRAAMKATVSRCDARLLTLVEPQVLTIHEALTLGNDRHSLKVLS